MKRTLKGHRALITGASSGIGKEFAKQLGGLGADLILVARRKNLLEELAESLIKEYGISVDTLACDLNEPDASKTLFQKAVSKKEVTFLVNNAGLGKYGHFVDFPYEDHARTIQINAVVPTELTYLFVKHMLEHGKKSYITQVASIAAFQPVGNFAVYSATKSYLKTFSDTLAFELQKTNVSFLCLCPGGTYTEFFIAAGQKITKRGHHGMMSAELVVKDAIDAQLKGKKVLIPGMINQLACFLPRLLPNKLSLFLAYHAMNQAVEKEIPLDSRSSTKEGENQQGKFFN